jgi:hypothetical protein
LRFSWKQIKNQRGGSARSLSYLVPCTLALSQFPGHRYERFILFLCWPNTAGSGRRISTIECCPENLKQNYWCCVFESTSNEANWLAAAPPEKLQLGRGCGMFSNKSWVKNPLSDGFLVENSFLGSMGCFRMYYITFHPHGEK